MSDCAPEHSLPMAISDNAYFRSDGRRHHRDDRQEITTEDDNTATLCDSASGKKSTAQMTEPGTSPDENNLNQKPRMSAFRTDGDVDLELGQTSRSESAVVAGGAQVAPPSKRTRKPSGRDLTDKEKVVTVLIALLITLPPLLYFTIVGFQRKAAFRKEHGHWPGWV